MAVIKQKTVGDTTVKLKRLQNDFPEMSDNRYMYVVVDETGVRFEDPVFTKEEGLMLFEETVEDIQRGMNIGSVQNSSDPFL